MYQSNVVVQARAYRALVKFFISNSIYTIISSCIGSYLNIVIYYLIISQFIGSDRAFEAIPYIGGGLIIQQSFSICNGDSSFRIFFLKQNRSIEDLLVAPINNHIILLSVVVAAIIRSIIANMPIFIFFLFYGLKITSPLSFLLIQILSSSIGALSGVLVSLLIDKSNQLLLFTSIILPAVFVLSGTLVNFNNGLGYALSLINPSYHLVNLAKNNTRPDSVASLGIKFLTNKSTILWSDSLIYCLFILVTLIFLNNLLMQSKLSGLRK
jgi:ABC-2 type transport system permease protein